MNRIRLLTAVLPLLIVPAQLAAQNVDVRARLAARGLPPALADQVATIATGAAARGVPSGPLADKAIEGWAKHVPDTRIVVAVQSFADRMAVAVDAVRAGGMTSPSGQVVAAAAEAMGGGLGAADVRAVVNAAPSASVAAPGLSVAAALAAQGLGNRQAVSIVVGAMHNHRSVADLLDLPSVARSLEDQGMNASEIGDHILDADGDGHAGSRSGGLGGHPTGIPQGNGGTGHDHQPDLQLPRGPVRAP